MDTEKLEKLEAKVDKNYNDILNNINRLHSHEAKITSNENQIRQNTGAIEVLHTIKTYNNRFFIMWFVTFIALLGMIGYVIYLSNDIRTVTTQEVEQDTGEGSNYFVGGDIDG